MQAEVELLAHLQATLSREYGILDQNDIASLEPVTAEKRRRVEDLEVIGRQRKSLMDSMIGADSSAYDVEEMFANDAGVSQLWKQLSESAERCREMNRANGSVVDAVTRHVSQALEVLQGKQLRAGNPEQVYDQTGHARTEAVKHTLIQV